MKKKLTIILIAILIVINLSAFATLTYRRYCAFHKSCPLSEHMSENECYLYRELNLSDEQVQQITALKKEFYTNVDPISAKLNKKRFELVGLLSETKPDTNQINDLIREVDNLQAGLQKHVIYFLLQEKEILNAKQQKKFLSLIEDQLVQRSQNYRIPGIECLEDSCKNGIKSLNNYPNH